MLVGHNVITFYYIVFIHSRHTITITIRDRRQVDFVHRSRTCSARGGGGWPLNPRLKRK